MGNCFGRHELTEAELRQRIRVIDTTDVATAGDINKSGSKPTSRPNDDDDMFDNPSAMLATSLTPDEYYEDENDGDDSDSVELKLAFSAF